MMDPDDEDSEVGLGKFRSLHAKLSRRYVELSQQLSSCSLFLLNGP